MVLNALVIGTTIIFYVLIDLWIWVFDYFLDLTFLPEVTKIFLRNSNKIVVIVVDIDKNCDVNSKNDCVQIELKFD